MLCCVVAVVVFVYMDDIQVVACDPSHQWGSDMDSLSVVATVSHQSCGCCLCAKWCVHSSDSTGQGGTCMMYVCRCVFVHMLVVVGDYK